MKRFRWLAFLCVIAVVVAACGRSDNQSSSETTTTSKGTSSGGASSGAFGTSDVVCKSGSPSGSPAQGVSPTEIQIGTLSDPGFAGRPGLNQELFDTATVFAKWCNAAGGINGRKIVVNQRDAALFDVKAKMTESCANDFMTVGGGVVFDQDGVQTRLSCLMPDIAGYAVSPQARGADLLIQPVPNSTKTLPIGDYRYLGEKYPAATKAYGILAGDVETTKIVGRQADEAVQSLGWKKVYDDVWPAAGLSDWTPYAQKIKDNGVKGLIWVGEPENLGKLLVALNDIGYTLDFIRTDTNNYDQKLIDTGGSAVKNVYIRSAFDLFENAKGNNPTQQYLDAFKKYLPNGKAQREPRPAGVVGLAALRHRRERVRERPDPQVRVRQRQEDQGVDRRWAPHGVRSRDRRRHELLHRDRRVPVRLQDRERPPPERGCVPLPEGRRVHPHR